MAARRVRQAGRLAVAVVAALASTGLGPQTATKPKLDVIYVATPPEVVDRMLALGDPKPGETLIDLGSGDGRVVIAAAKRDKVRAVGVELDPKRVRESRAMIDEAGLADRATIREGDLFAADLSQADVVTMYLLHTINARLLPKLAKLKPGARVVCHSFDLRGVTPNKVERVPLAGGGVRTVYLYVAPLAFERQPAAPKSQGTGRD